MYLPPLKLLSALLIFSLWGSLIYSQPNTGIFTQIEDISHRFSQKEVKDIIQDREGYIWIATTSGLFKYDGYDLKLYQENPLDSTSLGGSFIRCLEIDTDSSLWIGTSGAGLYRYDRYRDNFAHFPILSDSTTSATIDEVNDILLDSKGKLWIVSTTTLGYFDRKQEKIILLQSDADTQVKFTKLEEDAQKRIWASTGADNDNLYQIDSSGQTFHLFTFDTNTINIPDRGILDMASDREGNLWISTEDAKLYQLQSSSNSLRVFSFIDPSDTDIVGSSIWAITPDPQGNLWLGTHAKGLIYFNPKNEQTTYFKRDPTSSTSIASDLIACLYLDTAGILWVGQLGDGVSKLQTQSDGFTLLPFTEKGLEQGKLHAFKCILEDRKGNIWAGTWGNGVYKYDLATGRSIVYKHRPEDHSGLANNMIWDIMEDSRGDIWLATHGGLQRYEVDKEIFHTYGADEGLDFNAIRSLWEDRKGTLWVGTFSGLYKREKDSSTFEFVDDYANNSKAIVNEIYEDSRGRIWLAIFAQGLYQLEKGKWRAFHQDRENIRSLNSQIILDIAEDSKGQIWLGTQGGGLNLFVEHPTTPDSSFFKHWRSYNSGLPSDNIFNMGIDQNDQIWISTSYGLFSFNISNHLFTPHRLMGMNSGLIVESEIGPKGHIYVGDAKYICRFHSVDISQKTQSPPIKIHDLSVNNKSLPIRYTIADSISPPSPLEYAIPYSSSLTLTYDQSDITFFFTAIDFLTAHENQFRYKLEGYDNDWIIKNPFERSAVYTNLSPGKYTFHVEVTNSKREWDNTNTTLSLTITPPWWWTRWAQILYIIGLFLLIRTIYLFQLKRKLMEGETQRLRELDLAKTRLITNVTHEFRTPLTVIIGTIQHIRELPKKWSPEILEVVERNSKQLLLLVNQMLDLSKLEAKKLPLHYQQGNIIAYLGYLVESFHSHAESQEINLSFQKEKEYLKMDFDPSYLSTIISNLVSNAIKFTPAGGKVIVQTRKIGGELEINVQDNGIGIPPEDIPHIFDRFFQVDDSSTRSREGTGIGLALVKELLDQMNGKIRVSSQAEKNTSFRILLPIKNNAPLWTEERPQLPEQGITTPTFNLEVSSKDPQKPLVLIIEDNKDVANYTATCLKHEYRISFAENGLQGVEKAKEKIPDMIICDVMMPQMNGYEVCQKLKNDSLTSHIPIIMLTAKADDKSRIRGFQQGADAYLVKPFQTGELEIRLQKLIEIRKKLKERYKRFPEKTQTEDTYVYEDAFMQKLRSIVLEKMMEDAFSLEILCHELAISRSQLHKKLVALTGRSTSHVVRSIRLQKARELVRLTTLNFSEIAFKTGFKTASHFSATFAEEFGQTPTQMRTKSKKKQ